MTGRHSPGWRARPSRQRTGRRLPNVLDETREPPGLGARPGRADAYRRGCVVRRYRAVQENFGLAGGRSGGLPRHRLAERLEQLAIDRISLRIVLGMPL